MPRGGCHGQPRLSLHGVARHQRALLHPLGWRSLLQTLRRLEGNPLRAGECQDCEVEEMREQIRTNQSWDGRTLKMVPMRSADCTKKIADMVARRAFQISEARGFAPGHEMEDWQRAESEIVSPICGGWAMANDRIVVTASAALFKQGAIEICVEPRRLAIFGRSVLPRGTTCRQRIGTTRNNRKSFAFLTCLSRSILPERQRGLTIACWKCPCPRPTLFTGSAPTRMPPDSCLEGHSFS